MYHHIIYMCYFLVNLDDFFIVIYTGFHSRLVSIAYVASYWNSYLKLYVSLETISADHNLLSFCIMTFLLPIVVTASKV